MNHSTVHNTSDMVLLHVGTISGMLIAFAHNMWTIVNDITIYSLAEAAIYPLIGGTVTLGLKLAYDWAKKKMKI